jgi:hypothetical protein
VHNTGSSTVAALLRSPALPLTSQVTNSGWSTKRFGEHRRGLSRDMVECQQDAIGGGRGPVHPFRQVSQPHLRVVVRAVPDGTTRTQNKLTQIGRQSRGGTDNTGILRTSSDRFLHRFPLGTFPVRANCLEFWKR